MVLDNSDSRFAGVKCRHIWNLLPPRQRRPLQQIRKVLLPQRRVAGSAVATRVAARRDEDVAPVLHALDFALENSELRRVALVVGGVDRDERRADALQA